MLQGKTAIVTGSSLGIGLGIAKAYLQHGAQVVLTSERSLEQSPDVQLLLQQYTSARYIQVNILEATSPDRLIDFALQQFGRIDILVNNVGTFREPAFGQLQQQDFDFIFRLNVWTAIALTQALIQKNPTAGGRLLFTSSLNGSRSEPAHTLYDASKGALNALIRQLAIELAPLGYTTAGVAPGLVETPLTDFGLRSDPAARQAILDQIPLRQIATVEQIADWFVFLGSDAARYATGIIIPVDGGLDAQQMPSRPVTEAEKSPNR